METSYTIQRDGGAEAAAFFGSCVFMAIVVIFALTITGLMIWAFCKIFKKAGYHWALGLLILVPFGNLIAPLILAFGEWPILRRPAPLQTMDEPTPENWRGK